jgi:hypothetical protein
MVGNRGIKYNIRKNKILRASKYNKREVTFPCLSSIRSIGIVSDVHVDMGEIDSKFSAHSSSLFFVSEIRTKANDDPGVYLNDLNIWGIPKLRRIETFVNQPFDLLINLSEQVNDNIEYVCAKSVAKFKINTRSNGPVYDLVIEQTKGNISTLLSEIERTVSNFNRNI